MDPQTLANSCGGLRYNFLKKNIMRENVVGTELSSEQMIWLSAFGMKLLSCLCLWFSHSWVFDGTKLDKFIIIIIIIIVTFIYIQLYTEK